MGIQQCAVSQSKKCTSSPAAHAAACMITYLETTICFVFGDMPSTPGWTDCMEQLAANFRSPASSVGAADVSSIASHVFLFGDNSSQRRGGGGATGGQGQSA